MVQQTRGLLYPSGFVRKTIMIRREFIKMMALFGFCSSVKAGTASLIPEVPAKAELSDNAILFLGTGAGEGIPSFYCDCNICRQARKLGGKNIRTRTAFQIGETIRIDWGPDGAAQSWKHNLEAGKLKHLFFTHSHEDHFYTGDFWVRRASQIPNNTVLNVYGNKEVFGMIDSAIGGKWEKHLMRFTELVPGKKVILEDNGFEVTALHANHTAPENSLMFHFKMHGKEALFTGDTGEFMASAWEYLKGCHLDLILADTTWCFERIGGGHLGFYETSDYLKKMRAMGIANEKTRVYTVHMAHCKGAKMHSELERLLPELGLIPGYDGLIVDVTK